MGGQLTLAEAPRCAPAWYPKWRALRLAFARVGTGVPRSLTPSVSRGLAAPSLPSPLYSLLSLVQCTGSSQTLCGFALAHLSLHVGVRWRRACLPFYASLSDSPYHP